jgi:hypothetical protein
MRELETVERRANSKREAVHEAAKLLQENASRFSEDVRLEIEVYSELEWKSGEA